MKNNLLKYAPLASLPILASAVIAMLGPAQGQQHVFRKNEFVVLQAQEFYYSDGDGKRQWSGFYVYNYDASAGAPKLTMPITEYPYEVTTNRLAQTLSDLVNQGYDVTFTDGRNYVLKNR